MRFSSWRDLNFRALTLGVVLSAAGATVVGETVTVRATIAPSTPESFACVTEGRFYLRLDVTCSPAGAVRKRDRFRIVFRDLFTGKEVASCSRAVRKSAEKTSIVLTPKDVELLPASYHVRVDLMRKGQLLSAAAPGCCRVYVAREGESAHHVLGSFLASTAAYMWDPDRRMYYGTVPHHRLSESGDPFDPVGRAAYVEGLRAELKRIGYSVNSLKACTAESQADAGGGLLGAARAFRTMGETERAVFCEQALRWTIALSLRRMTSRKDGEVIGRRWSLRQQDCLLLKMFCDSWLYFRDVVGDKKYTGELIGQIRPVGRYQFSHKNPLGCSQGKVYDGRVLGGLATYCLTERKADGKFDDAHVATVLDFARRASGHIRAKNGWYANGTGECHTGYGNMNILSGLMISRRVALAVGKTDLAEELKKSIETAFDFLARRHAAATGHIAWIPSRHGSWCQGFTHELLNEMIELFGGKKDAPEPWTLCYKGSTTTIKRLVWYRQKLWQPTYNYYYHVQYGSYGRFNVLGAILPSCREYKQALAGKQPPGNTILVGVRQDKKKEATTASFKISVLGDETAPVTSAGVRQDKKKEAKKAATASIKISVLGDETAMATSAKLDCFHPCVAWRTDKVNHVRRTQTWWSILGRICTDWLDRKVELTPAAVAGDTAAKGLARLEHDVLRHSPDYVLVLFGANDARNGVAPEEFKATLAALAETVVARGAVPVLMTPAAFSERMIADRCTMDEVRRRQGRLRALASVVRSLAEEKSLPLIDLHAYFLANRLAHDHLFEGWLPDGVAQSAMAPFVAGELLPMLGVDDFPTPTLCDYRKVYSDAANPKTKHSGFTDMTRFRGDFYVAFRAGMYHGFRGMKGGKVIVLRSTDGVKWVKDAELQVEGFLETRDPKFLQVDDRLILYGICHRFLDSNRTTATCGFERIGPGQWSEPFECTPGIFWRPKKWRDRFVAAVYDWKVDQNEKRHYGVSLFQSPKGRKWEKVSTILDYSTDGNETALLVDGDRLRAFSRTQEGSNQEMLISTYSSSKNNWKTVSSGRIIQAPCVFMAGKQTLITGRYCSQSDARFRQLRKDWTTFTHYDIHKQAGKGYQTAADSSKVDPTRVEEYHHGLRTGLFAMDGARPRLLMELLSAGDSSYTGVVSHGDEYLISDYSMHEYYPPIRRPGDWESPCDIYVSRIRFGGRKPSMSDRTP